MKEYDKYPVRYKVLKGNGNTVNPCILFFLLRSYREKKKQEKAYEGRRIWVALIMDQENFSRRRERKI